MQVMPELISTPLGTSSIWMRTGTAGSRTHSKVGVRIDEELGAGGIVGIGDAAGDALDMPAQCGAAIEQIDLGLSSETYGRDLAFLEIPRNSIESLSINAMISVPTAAY